MEKLPPEHDPRDEPRAGDEPQAGDHPPAGAGPLADEHPPAGEHPPADEHPPAGEHPPGGAPAPGRRPPRAMPATPWILAIVLLVVAVIIYSNGSNRRMELTYGSFYEQLTAGHVTEAKVRGGRIYGQLKDPADGTQHDFLVVLPPYPLIDNHLDELLRTKLGHNYAVSEPTDSSVLAFVAYALLLALLLAAGWMILRRSRDQMLGGGLLSGFMKSPARRYEATAQPVTFGDVAGLEGVKDELQEVVEFLKNPAKFQRLGGRVPKGILLMGPPGTGKTLLGRAVAGEAGVPFFSISGSEFIQMFVGVGAGRVRDMFATAKAHAPSILFIDEIDAVGRHRGAGLGGGHDEREQTLNQILSEMDGFTQSESVIVMAATNRPDVLDPALLRPGRFDRHVTVDRPNRTGRLAIFKVHVRGVILADGIDLDRLAAGTVGLTGADIRNLVNEAALWATRSGKDYVEMSDFEHARDKVLMGPKRDEILTGKEKRMTAYHEMGHALLAWLVPALDHVHKVSIIPRGRSLGATQLLPEEDRLSISESEIHARLLFLLGGRAAEKLVFGELTAGAEDDLKRATALARRMVTHWGMSDKLGPVAFRNSEEHPFLGKEITEPREFSDHTARIIDEEVVRILREAAQRAEQLLREHREQLDAVAQALERDETLDEAQIAQLIGPPAHKLNGARPVSADNDAVVSRESKPPAAG